MRRPILVLGLILVLIVLGIVFYTQLSAPTLIDEDELPATQAMEFSSGSPGLSYDMSISGALEISELRGISDANLAESDGDRSARREIWISVAGDWLVVLAFPADARVNEYTFEGANTDAEQTAYVIAPPEEDAPDALAFQQDSTGYITITAVDEELISGDFAFTVSATDGSDVQVEGSFTNIHIRD